MTRFAGTLRRFGADDRGAITIDWVALTSGLLLLGITVVYSTFNVGVSSLVGDINGTLEGLGDDIAAQYADGSAGPDDGTPIATGNAAQRACSNTLKFVVCVGNK